MDLNTLKALTGLAESLKELKMIREELENIRLILEYRYAPWKTSTREKVDGELIVTHSIRSNPLEEIRKEMCRSQ